MNENQSLDPLRNGMGGVRLDRYSTNTFYGLNFTDSVDDVYKTRKLDAKPNIIVKGGPNAKWYIKKFNPEVLNREIEKQSWRDTSRCTMYIIEWE